LCSTFATLATDFGQNDDKMTGYEDCAQQRNLTDRGRADARAIGAAAIRRLRSRSRRCSRARSAARAKPPSFGLAGAMIDARVRGGPAQTDDVQRYAALKTLLSTPVAPAPTVAIVSHGNPFHALAGAYLAEGEMAVVEPLGAMSGFRIVAKVPLNGWDALH
jgi:broad specificity phosphatase PhoE